MTAGPGRSHVRTASVAGACHRDRMARNLLSFISLQTRSVGCRMAENCSSPPREFLQYREERLELGNTDVRWHYFRRAQRQRRLPAEPNVKEKDPLFARIAEFLARGQD